MFEDGFRNAHTLSKKHYRTKLNKIRKTVYAIVAQARQARLADGLIVLLHFLTLDFNYVSLDVGQQSPTANVGS